MTFGPLNRNLRVSQGDVCALHSLPLALPLALTATVSVAIKPDHTRRDDIELREDTEWLARVADIRRHEVYGPVSGPLLRPRSFTYKAHSGLPDPPPPLVVQPAGA